MKGNYIYTKVQCDKCINSFLQPTERVTTSLRYVTACYLASHVKDLFCVSKIYLREKTNIYSLYNEITIRKTKGCRDGQPLLFYKRSILYFSDSDLYGVLILSDLDNGIGCLDGGDFCQCLTADEVKPFLR